MTLVTKLDRSVFSKVRSDCWSGDRKWETKTKDEQRKLVLSYFHKVNPRHHQLLSLPGYSWAFEKMFVEQYPRSRVICVEKHPGVFEFGKRHMPGESRREMNLETPLGEVGAFATSRGVFVNADLEYLFRCSTRNAKFSHYALKEFWIRLKRNSCIWIDSMSTATSEETGVIAERLAAWTEKNRHTIPIAYSIVASRDDLSGDRHRISVLANRLGASRFRSFEIDEVTRYLGVGNTPMVTICGRFLSRR